MPEATCGFTRSGWRIVHPITWMQSQRSAS